MQAYIAITIMVLTATASSVSIGILPTPKHKHAPKKRDNGPATNGCESKCPVYVEAQGICASNGLIYTDLCRAKCQNKSLTQLFACKFPYNGAEAGRCKDQRWKRLNPVIKKKTPRHNHHSHSHSDSSDCKKDKVVVPPAPDCEEEVVVVPPAPDCEEDEVVVPPPPSCESKCPIYIRANLICASNGKIYTDECRAQCQDKSVKELFNCGLLNEAQCQKKCDYFIEKERCYAHCPSCGNDSQICANDGNVYDSECRAKCHKSSLVGLFSCGKLSNAACQVQCKKQIKIVECQDACPKLRRRLMYWCANDGKVYDDLCKAQCVDSHISFSWNCEDRGFTTDNKAGCEKACTKNYTCDQKCEAQTCRYVCAADGFVYRNACEAQCHGSKPSYPIREKNEMEEKRCAQRCNMVGASLE